MTPNPLALLAPLLLAALAVPGSAAQLDATGREFRAAFLPNLPWFAGPPTVEVHLGADAAVRVTVEYPADAPTVVATVDVVPGAVAVVPLPASASLGWTPDTIGIHTVRCHADLDFTCVLVNRLEASSDSALALPVDTLNRDYVVVDYDPSFRPSLFVVHAAYDDTLVTITPARPLVGHPAGQPFTVRLRRGEGYVGASAPGSGAGASIVGTLVRANRPVGLTHGNGVTQIPYGTPGPAHVFEVAPPVQSFGRSVLVTNLPNRPLGTPVRIVACEDATEVTVDGAHFASLDRGHWVETPLWAGARLVAANRPILVTQFLTSSSAPSSTLGNPAMGHVVPLEQYARRSAFTTAQGAHHLQNYATIVIPTPSASTLELDGVPLGAAAFTPAGTSGYSYAVVPLAPGAHTTTSAAPHAVTVSGYDIVRAYVQPASALLARIHPFRDANAPLCTVVNAIDETSASGIARDDRPTEDANGNGWLDGGEDANGNGQIDEDSGVFAVELLPGATNLQISVPPFVPAAGTVPFTVSLIDTSLPGSGVVRVTDGGGTATDCPVNLIGAECYLLLGFGAGATPFPIHGTTFTTRMAVVRASFPVTMTQGPTFVAPSELTFATRPLRVEVHMWNPHLFPGNPLQWSPTLTVRGQPGGAHTVETSGTPNGISLWCEFFTDAQGVVRMRFPFQIAGM